MWTESWNWEKKRCVFKLNWLNVDILWEGSRVWPAYFHTSAHLANSCRIHGKLHELQCPENCPSPRFWQKDVGRGFSHCLMILQALLLKYTDAYSLVDFCSASLIQSWKLIKRKIDFSHYLSSNVHARWKHTCPCIHPNCPTFPINMLFLFFISVIFLDIVVLISYICISISTFCVIFKLKYTNTYFKRNHFCFYFLTLFVTTLHSCCVCCST